jgi:ParB family transcriptional regulator, chromosome partitioning protein
MAKADELLKRSGGTLLQSASVRPGPAGMASVAGATVIRDNRKEGLDRSKTAWTIPLDKIARDPNQPREEVGDGDVETLVESLRTHGLIQPITVMWSDEAGHYRIVAGERRFRAATLAGWTSISCNVLDKPLAPDELLALQCVENLIREDLKPIEKARAFRTLLTVNGWPVTRIAKELGVSHSAVSQSLRLLDLPESVQGQVEAGELSPVAGYHVAQIEDPEVQAEVVERIVSEGLTRDETVEVVKQAKAKTDRAGGSKGRGVSKGKPAKLPTVRTIRTEAGPRVTVEYRKGVDDAVIASALREILAKLEGAGDRDGEVAA